MDEHVVLAGNDSEITLRGYREASDNKHKISSGITTLSTWTYLYYKPTHYPRSAAPKINLFVHPPIYLTLQNYESLLADVEK
jgi:hypothetical protein